MKTYTGSCHCQAVTFEITAEFTTGMRCNCSHCQRKGFVLGFAAEQDFVLKTGSDNLTTYHFNKNAIDHTFCKTCGVQSFAIGTDKAGNRGVMINLSCLEDFDVNSLEMTTFDGKSL